MKNNFKFIKFLSVILLGAFLFCGCPWGKDDDDDAKAVPLPDPTLPIKTIMVYMDGDNNLEEAALTDLNEMEAVNLGSDIKVIVLIDRIGGYETTSPDWTGTRLYEISYDSAGEGNSTIVSTRLSSTGLGISASSDTELNMGDPATLSKFINFCRTEYEGNYALILWNHGGGWEKKNNENNNTLSNSSFSTGLKNVGLSENQPSNKAVCWDQTSSNDPLYMNEVQSAVSNKGLTVIGFDACLMGMIEVAYEIRNKASYMIASEETEPGDGWEYNDWLAEFNASSGKTAVDLCDAVVDAYETRYDGAGDGDGTTLSALDLSKVDNVFSALNSFSQALYTDITTSTIQDFIFDEMFTNAEAYWLPDYGYDYNIDLWHFADLIEGGYDYCDTESAALKSAIDDCVINEWHNSSGHPDSHGLAIHACGTDPSNNLMMYYAYCNGNSEPYTIDFVQNSSNYWVPRYNGSGNPPKGPGLLYRILFESL